VFWMFEYLLDYRVHTWLNRLAAVCKGTRRHEACIMPRYDYLQVCRVTLRGLARVSTVFLTNKNKVAGRAAGAVLPGKEASNTCT
jgi:ribosomal protein S14